jgi:hypothetical protein
MAAPTSALPFSLKGKLSKRKARDENDASQIDLRYSVRSFFALATASASGSGLQNYFTRKIAFISG